MNDAHQIATRNGANGRTERFRSNRRPHPPSFVETSRSIRDERAFNGKRSGRNLWAIYALAALIFPSIAIGGDQFLIPDDTWASLPESTQSVKAVKSEVTTSEVSISKNEEVRPDRTSTADKISGPPRSFSRHRETNAALPAPETPAVSFDVMKLLDSESANVRRTAVRSLKQFTPTPALMRRVEELSDNDPDAITRGTARLLLSDWEDRLESTTASSDAESISFEFGGRSRRANPFADPIRSRTDTAVSNASASAARARASHQFMNQPTDDAGRSGAAVLRLGDSGRPAAEHIRSGVSQTAYSGIVPPAPRRIDAPEYDPTADSDDFEAIFDLSPASTVPAGRPRLLAEDIFPPVLDTPLNPPPIQDDVLPSSILDRPIRSIPFFPTLGFAGPTGVQPTEPQTSSHFQPVEDRWRHGFPEWNRYAEEPDTVTRYPYTEGRWWDPYNQNVLKGDYPIIGQHTFFNVEAELLMINEYRELPTPTTPFESTVDAGQFQFFGDPTQFLTTNFLFLRTELFHGNAGFKPIDWMVRLTPAVNLNYLDVNELAVVGPDVRDGTTRYDDIITLQEYFVEAKLADLSPHYDFMSMRIGSQPFQSDFRGFIFNDINQGVRLFGTRNANRDQFNIVFFDQLEKNTNAQLLNEFSRRDQQVFVANYYRQDFVYPGYTANTSIHVNNDGPSTQFDDNGFLVRPDPTGIFKEHRVTTAYLGFTGDGHMGKYNVSNAFYYVFGEDSCNPIAGTEQEIRAYMMALELSYDRDWVRFRGSFFHSSGDGNADNSTATGFDSILDQPQFAGGEFSYWQRQEIRLFGAALSQRESLSPTLRSSKIQGQANHVNPGIFIFNAGMDFEITPKLRMITNASYLMFDKTDVLETYTFQDDIAREIGVDLSIGIEYRPLLSDNIIIEAGWASLVPGNGMKDLFGKYDPFTLENSSDPELDLLSMAFVTGIFVY
ncbi:HEAT repeat domain-containing protein [Stratiformator vulcanicus]|uniref:Uncharacterized protein n=1 Tax=Stratiformator vulcanicus TaxID=2527980 RepID=A0A517QXP6_9PLAN|nr:HEAT repeat domain-containing protein [Stratiformator vulcanicus]QDT36411.1 hypothetical protein Pan189_07670 [Stratiformator vulcanicus]